jgi:hypothetical protein
VVYPIDRNRGTPLNAYCAMDIVRAALGVGPCQYILEAEGLESESPPTPDVVSRWVEELFRKGKDQKEAAAIKERLAAMAAQVRQVDSRVEGYREFLRQVLQQCEKPPAGMEKLAPDLRRIVTDVDRMGPPISEAADPVASAQTLGQAVVALIGKADALGECQKLAARIRALGAEQERALATYRMTVRRIREACRVAAGENQAAGGNLDKLRGQAEELLQKKQATGSRQ